MITAQIATLPERVDTLKLTVASLINQVDMMFVALNGHEVIPRFLQNNRKITYALMDNALGDGAKFSATFQRKGYILTCDDDLVYPEGYAKLMIDGVKKHGGIVTVLGKQYRIRPVKSFRSGYTQLYSCLNAVRYDTDVDVVGTGVMAYHADTINIDPGTFPRKNMADIWVAKLAHEQGIPLTVLAHPRGYVIYRKYPWRIWTSDHDDKYQTEILNSFLK